MDESGITGTVNIYYYFYRMASETGGDRAIIKIKNE